MTAGAPNRKSRYHIMMKKFNAYVVIVALALIIAGCGNKDEIKAPSDGADSTEVGIVRPDQEMRNAQIFLYNKGVRTTDVYADFIKKFEKYDSTIAWGLKVDFFDSTGKEISNLKADSGLIREKTNMMFAYGHVVVITQDSSQLETEELVWNAMENKIETDKFVTIVQHGDTLTGYGLEADQRLTHITLKRQVRGRLKNTQNIEP
jgi:LPS export ABC transporter protein LptC